MLSAFRLDPNTYLTDPTNPDATAAEKWQSFKDVFQLDDYKTDIYELLFLTPGCQGLFEKLGKFLFG